MRMTDGAAHFYRTYCWYCPSRKSPLLHALFLFRGKQNFDCTQHCTIIYGTSTPSYKKSIKSAKQRESSNQILAFDSLPHFESGELFRLLLMSSVNREAIEERVRIFVDSVRNGVGGFKPGITWGLVTDTVTSRSINISHSIKSIMTVL